MVLGYLVFCVCIDPCLFFVALWSLQCHDNLRRVCEAMPNLIESKVAQVTVGLFKMISTFQALPLAFISYCCFFEFI